MSTEELKYTTADFKSTQDVKWCPGCGDYSILAAVQRTLPKLEIKKEDIVFVSRVTGVVIKAYQQSSKKSN